MDPESNDNSITTDGGKTWRFLSRGVVIPTPFIEIDPADKKTVYIVTGPDIIHYSSDHFNTWNTLYPNLGEMTSFIIAPSNNTTFYAGYLSFIAKSTDKGNSWNKVSFPARFSSGVTLAVDPLDENVIYAAVFSYGITPGGMYKSIDGGISWYEINEGLSNNDWDILGIFIDPQKTAELYIRHIQ